MASHGDTATHAHPVWRDRTNYIIRVDLSPYGMLGSFEQLWTRTDENRETYELCCIPFFTYGMALGDLLTWDEGAHSAQVVTPSGRRCIRLAFGDPNTARLRHEELHGDLARCATLVEFSGDGYAAVDIENDMRASAVFAALQPWVDDGSLTWEWGSD